MDTILVTYASKYGSTREIAVWIGEVLGQAGLKAAVLPVNDVHGLSAYRAVILGSAVYIGKWQKAAVEFVRSQEGVLAKRPVWLFSSGPTGEGNAVDLVEGKRLPAELEPVAERIHPRDVAVFHGNIDPGKINFTEKWAIKNFKKKPFGDFRNWTAITAWAKNVANAIHREK